MSEVFLIKLELADDPNFRLAPPFGILYLASALEKHGFKVQLFHEIATPENLHSIKKAVMESKPLLCGFSSFSGPTLIPSLKLTRQIKAAMDVPIVWGGLHATMEPQQTLEHTAIDYVILNEGEETLVELAQATAAGQTAPEDLAAIRNLAFREKSEVRVTEPRPFIEDLDPYFPAWHLLPIEGYFYQGKFFLSDFGSLLPGDKIAPFLTSRGCPWRCGYCYNQFVNKRRFRAHSAQKVIEEIKRLKLEHRITAVVFEDDNLFTDRKRAMEIVTRINLPWSSSLRANNIADWGDDFVRDLKQTGCVELRIGAESGSDNVLDLMHKDQKVEQIRRSVDLCRTHGIRALLNFMLGIPGETWKEMKTTLNLMDELEALGDDVVVNGPSLYFPWPGTRLFDEAVEQGFQPPQRLEDWAIGWGHRQPLAPYVDKRARFVGFYRILAFRKDVDSLRFPLFAKMLRWVARKRWERRLFRFPVDYYLPNLIYQLLKRLGLTKAAQALYN
jgi:anaerobic magnesium-protoporphyrin IX monomethyl ester cyclase